MGSTKQAYLEFCTAHGKLVLRGTNALLET